MLKYKNEFSIAAMCRVLVVSRSGFYDWLVKQDKPRLLKHRQQQIDAHIAHAFNADKGRSGAIRVMLALDKKGIHYNRKTVALSLQRQGLRAKAAGKFKATTQSKHNLPVADNLLKQDFTASLHISEHSDHPFRDYTIADFAIIRSPIPRFSGHF